MSVSLVRRVLSFGLDVLAMGFLMAVSAVVWVPLTMFVALALAGRWDWVGWGLGMVGTIGATVVVLSALYLVTGVARGATWGMRRCGVAVTRTDGQRPSARQAMRRYLLGFLLPLVVPIVLCTVVAMAWETQHARRRPVLEVPAGSLVVPAESVLAYQRWEEIGRRARWWVELMPAVLYGSEGLLMLAWIIAHPQGQGWHDQAAGTLLRRAGGNDPSPVPVKA